MENKCSQFFCVCMCAIGDMEVGLRNRKLRRNRKIFMKGALLTFKINLETMKLSRLLWCVTQMKLASSMLYIV